MLRLAASICVLLMVINGTVSANEAEKLSEADRAAIIQKAMELKLQKDGPEKFSEYLVISTENMSLKLLPKIQGFNFKLMKPREIEKRQKKATRFRYLRIDELTRQGQFVNFSLGVIERCGGLPCHAHFYKFVFEKIDGQWQGRIHMIIC